jgi:1,2-diacylglycerol 3-beta-galactosyltransferase
MKRIVFLMSDTGNGHRAAAEAISTALKIKYGDAVHCEIVDVFKNYTPFPFRNFPEYYPRIVTRSSRLYGVGYRLSDTPRRARLLASALRVVSRASMHRLSSDYLADAIVSTHSIVTRPSLSAFTNSKNRPQFITVVVDLVSTHMFWYDKRCDLFLLPTEMAYQRGIKAGIQPGKMVVTGMPVHPRFLSSMLDKPTSRNLLGWDRDLPTVLLIGGGDGMGRLYDIAHEINENRLPCQLTIITGRNVALRRRLEAINWNHPVHIYGFANNMYELMSASDVLITKAGSLTISEACVVGLPMLLYEALPGQEEGNLNYIIDFEAGFYAPSTKTIVRRLREMLAEDGSILQRCAANAKKLGRPEAVWQIAESIWNQL